MITDERMNQWHQNAQDQAYDQEDQREEDIGTLETIEQRLDEVLQTIQCLNVPSPHIQGAVDLLITTAKLERQIRAHELYGTQQ